jgi:hypothetical protein
MKRPPFSNRHSAEAPALGPAMNSERLLQVAGRHPAGFRPFGGDGGAFPQPGREPASAYGGLSFIASAGRDLAREGLEVGDASLMAGCFDDRNGKE